MCVHVQKIALSELLYLADNIAWFAYGTLEEVLYVIHQVDLTLAVSTSTVVQIYKKVISCSYSKIRYPTCHIHINSFYM